jgi:hypothetical protein
LAKIIENIDPTPVINLVLNDIEKILDFDEERRKIYRYPQKKTGELIVGYLRYKDYKVPSWTSNRSLRDEVNQLIPICRKIRNVPVQRFWTITVLP